jgi:DNA repair protein RecO (recombination protein O)
MAAEKALAIVLRTTDWSETSRIATIWTREFGKVRVLAKGGRRLKSNFENALDLLTLCRIVFLRKSSGGLDLLTEARVEERFPRLRSDLAALYAAYYIAELLSDWTEDYDPHPVLFDEALAALRAFGAAHEVSEGVARPERRERRGEESTHTTPFEGPLATSGRAIELPVPANEVSPGTPGKSDNLGDPSIPPGPRLARFELVLLRELGYTPALSSCAVCARDLQSTMSLAFSPAAGGVVCPECRSGQRDSIPLSSEAWQALRDLNRQEDAWRQNFSSEARKQVRYVLNQYITYSMGRQPRLLPYLGS